MRRSSRIASTYGTEWSNLPSMKSQRQQAQHQQAQHQQAPVSLSAKKEAPEASGLTYGIYTMTEEKIYSGRAMIKQLLDKIESHNNYINRAQVALSLFQYMLDNTGILFAFPVLMSTTIHKINDIEKQIAQHEINLLRYFDTADCMLAPLNYSQQLIGQEILKEGMKARIEEKKLWEDLRATLTRLRAVLTESVAVPPAVPTAAPTCCPHSKKIENKNEL